MMERIRNARITDVTLNMRDHGALVYGLVLDMGGSGCVYGGYAIGNGFLGAKEFSGSAKGIEAMMRIMDVVGVEAWEDLRGKYVRIVDPGLGGTVDRIGNALRDRWFSQREFFSGEGTKGATE